MNIADLAFSWPILGRPLLAGLLVVSTHVLLGRKVLERGIIFIDITIAQAAALGVILASVFGFAEVENGGFRAQIAAGVAALATAALLSWTESRFRYVQEALIGSLYVLAASIAVLVLSRNSHGAEQMQQLLAGQILWISYSQLVPVALLYAGVLAVWALWAARAQAAFYYLFAVVVTASVQLIGVYLVFATLILPALGTFGLPGRKGLALGYALGAAGYALGLWLSVLFDLPAGPFIVCVLAGLTIIAAGVRGWRRVK